MDLSHLRQPDLFALLSARHARILRLFDRFAALPDALLRGRICAALAEHARIEQDIVYPALLDALGHVAPLDAALADHRDADELLAEVAFMQPSDNLYAAKFIMLGEYLRHHIETEQNQLFPLAQDTALDLDALRDQVQGNRASPFTPARRRPAPCRILRGGYTVSSD